MVSVSASVAFPCAIKVQKISSGTGSPEERGHKTVVCVYIYTGFCQCFDNAEWVKGRTKITGSHPQRFSSGTTEGGNINHFMAMIQLNLC